MARQCTRIRYLNFSHSCEAITSILYKKKFKETKVCHYISAVSKFTLTVYDTLYIQSHRFIFKICNKSNQRPTY